MSITEEPLSLHGPSSDELSAPVRPIDVFFEDMERQHLTLTFDDVLLTPRFSDVDPKATDQRTWFSRHVPLNIPIVSAAMDKVTESPMAIALAKLGGLGIIHRNLSPTAQRDHVRQVKFSLQGKIHKPITVPDTWTLEQVENMRRQRQFTFYSFLAVNGDGQVTGLIGHKTFQRADRLSELVGTVMTPFEKLVIAPPDTTIDEAWTGYFRPLGVDVLPLLNEDRTVAGMYLFKEVHDIVKSARRGYNLDDLGRLRVGAAVGVGEEALERVKLLCAADTDVIVIDASHGATAEVIRMLDAIKRDHAVDVVVGNFAYGEDALLAGAHGADGVKIGVGPGSICTTRQVAGGGTPQLSAIWRVSKAYRQNCPDVPICADGGIKYTGDVNKALAAGAWSVMVGNALAGTTEAPGEVVPYQGSQWKIYRGMGSISALVEREGIAADRYMMQGVPLERLVAQGVEGMVPYRGDLAPVIHQFTGALGYGMGLIGAQTIFQIWEKAMFDRQTTNGIRESQPHDILMVPELRQHLQMS